MMGFKTWVEVPRKREMDLFAWGSKAWKGCGWWWWYFNDAVSWLCARGEMLLLLHHFMSPNVGVFG